MNTTKKNTILLQDEDAAELNAISEVFCKNRKTPLLVGCVKSNMGHCESSSAFCGLVKAVISMEKGMIPQNLHYEKPNSCCPGLTKGILKVLSAFTVLYIWWQLPCASHTWTNPFCIIFILQE